MDLIGSNLNKNIETHIMNNATNNLANNLNMNLDNNVLQLLIQTYQNLQNFYLQCGHQKGQVVRNLIIPPLNSS